MYARCWSRSERDERLPFFCPTLTSKTKQKLKKFQHPAPRCQHTSASLCRFSRRYGFLLATECKQRIHQLARSFDAPFFRGQVQECAMCKKLSPNPP